MLIIWSKWLQNAKLSFLKKLKFYHRTYKSTSSLTDGHPNKKRKNFFVVLPHNFVPKNVTLVSHGKWFPRYYIQILLQVGVKQSGTNHHNANGRGTRKRIKNRPQYINLFVLPFDFFESNKVGWIVPHTLYCYGK